MSGLAYVFPGQGSQSVGMLVAKSSEVAATYEEASEALGYDMGELISSGPEEVLNQTEYTQPALLTVSVALFRYAMNNNAEFPDVVLGHSLGEYAALVAAEAIRFEDAVKSYSNIPSIGGRKQLKILPDTPTIDPFYNFSNQPTICKCVIALRRTWFSVWTL